MVTDMASRFADYLVNYPVEMVGSEPAETIFDRYHTPDYVLVNDGRTFDRAKTLAHVGPVRRNFVKHRATTSIEPHGLIADADRGAAHYTMHVTGIGPEPMRIEIFTLVEFAADGRVRKETSFTQTRKGEE